MGDESAVENGPLVGDERADGLGPTICQVLNNLIKINSGEQQQDLSLDIGSTAGSH